MKSPSRQRSTNEADLFADAEQNNFQLSKPLAARMRPRSLEHFVGQQHFLGPGKLLRRLIDSKRLSSILLYGPPGTGKTTLASLLAHETGGQFRTLSAVTSGVKELRETLDWARDEVAVTGKRPILFIDEIHRFNRSQQDALLPDVESGVVTFVGATTSNPFFSVNGALLSRSQIFQFQPIEPDDIRRLVMRAITDRRDGLGYLEIVVEEDAMEYLSKIVEGDARKALSAIEIAVLSSQSKPIRVTLELIRESIQAKTIQFDASGDQHYDLASALIKSIRGSDCDASLYWLARAIESGEDIRFICRRLVILASEDIGNADPHSLPLAIAAMQACEFIGLPECQLTLSQAVIYLSLAPKSNAATTAIAKARADVREGSLIPVPIHLRDGHYAGSERLGHGIGYQYSHETENGIAAQEYLGVDRVYYDPTDRGMESEFSMRLAMIRQQLKGG